MWKYKNIPIMALLLATGIVLSYIEYIIPIPLPMGFKIGFANIVAVFALYKLNFSSALIISLLRVVIINVMFGSFTSFLFGVAGAFLSLTVMWLLKRQFGFNAVAVSAVGGACHNIGQVLVCAVMMQTVSVFWYLTLLIPFGVISGIIMGMMSSIVIDRID